VNVSFSTPFHILMQHGTMSTKNSTSTPPVVSLISGAIVGGVEAAATYPFEFAKTRAQLRSSSPGTKPSRSSFAIVTQVYRAESACALYKGCSALIVRSIAKVAVRFLTFAVLQNFLLSILRIRDVQKKRTIFILNIGMGGRGSIGGNMESTSI
jgi:hypothetical protein